MDDSEKHISKILSLTILFLLVIGVLVPIMSGYNEQDIHSESNSENSVDGMQLTSDDEWLIDDKVYMNSSTELDYHITIEDDGHLIIKDSTLTLLIDEWHPWEIEVRDGGTLELQNSTISTQLRDDDVLRPFIKTNITAHGGSTILLEDNSEFRFPGWVYIENSEFIMRSSSFERLEDIPFTDPVRIQDNNDCPRLTVHDDSYVLIEDSSINDYYRNPRLNEEPMEWRTFIDEMNEADGEFYELAEDSSIVVDEWYLHDPMFRVGDYRYVNPYDRISTLYLEVQFYTEEHYDGPGSIEYYVDGEWKEAFEIEHSEQIQDDHKDIWEIDLDHFHTGERAGDEYFLKDLDVRLNNDDTSGDNNSIMIDKINLVSQYNNDINIRDSEVMIINSNIDVDYEPANTDPRENEFEGTDNTTWMQDANLERSAIRLINSDFRGYGVYPRDEWDPENADPFLITDEPEDSEGSRNRTWYYRWVTITAVDAAGTPLPETTIEISLDEHYKNVSEQLYENVQDKNHFYNNIEAWDYMNRTWNEYYDPAEDEFETDGNGEVNLFLVSDRVNHPQDWPNTRSVGDYHVKGSNDMGTATGEVNLPSFPRMNESATFHDFELVFDDEIPLPDFNVTDEDLRILDDGQEVTFVNPGVVLDLELDVTNDGEADVENGIEVGFYFDDFDIGRILIDTDTIDGLDEGETQTASIEFDTTDLYPQDYEILGIVDPDDEYEEYDTENNIAGKTLTISERANLRPNQIIPDPGFTITYGDDLYIQAEVENIGGTDAENVNVSFFYNDDQFIGSDHIDLPGNQSVEYTEFIQWEDYPDPGEYDVTVQVDPENDIDESDETNNELTETFTILSQADLVIDYLDIEPSAVYGGEVVHIEGRISNTGETRSSEMEVHFYLDRGTGQEEVIHSEVLPGLGGDESAIIDYDWTAEMAFDDLNETRTITMVVEPEIEEELSESGDIDIMKPADISVSADDISFSTELSQVDDTLQIEVIVRNTGGAGTDVDVSFYEGFPEEDNRIDTYVDLGIGPDSSEVANISWTPRIRGNREIHVIADYEDDEVNGEDNHAMVVKPIFSVDYNNDLIIDGNDERVITGSYDRNGFVVIQDSGELRITGSNPRAVFGLIMDSDNRYSILLRDQGTLEVDHGWLRSDYQFNIHMEDQSELIVQRDSIMPDNIHLIAEDDPYIRIDDTEFGGSMDITGGTFLGEESQFTSPDVFFQPSEVDLTNSTFQSDLVDFHDTTGSLTWVETGAVEATGDSEIELYRWVRATALSQTGLTIQGAEVTAQNLDYDYSISGRTDGQGIAYLKVFTDLITDEEPAFYGNYEFTAEYVPEGVDEVYEIEPFTESLPHYTSQQYIIDHDMHFTDLAIPDLSISGGDIEIDVDEISLGDEVWIEASVENIGETEAQDVSVYFYRVYEEQEDEQIGFDNLASVSTDEPTTARVSWTADMVDEMQTSESVGIRVYVDPDVEPLPDPNLDNNEATRVFTVNSLPSLEFASEIVLLRDGEELFEDDEIVEADDITINITLANTGGTDLINGTVQISVSGTQLVRENVDVESDSELEFSYDWFVREHGEHQIEVWYNSSEEETVSSAYIDRTIDIDTMVLQFADLRFLETEPGEDKIVEGTLERDDGKEVPGIDVTAYLLDDDGQISTQNTETSGDDGEFFIYIPEPPTDGVYTLSLSADYPGAEELEDTGESLEVGEIETGIPLWMIIAVIGAIAAGSVGGIFAYIKIQGPSEWVECGNCGTTIPADVQACPECGVEFETETAKCSECGEWIPADSDECPNCGSTFIKTGKEVQDYQETMKNQYDAYVDKQRKKAKAELGDDFTEEEFMEWWQDQPSYITFDEWIEREEARRKEGGIECSECGALNSVDDAICQKCGSTLISVGEETEEEDLDIDLSDTDKALGLEIDSEGEELDEDISETEDAGEEPFVETEEAEDKSNKVVKKKVKKKPKKVVKKKVKKEPEQDED